MEATLAPDTTATTCTDCGGPAILHMHGARYAGIWECQSELCAASDSCQHEQTHTEDGLDICDQCDMTVTGEY